MSNKLYHSLWDDTNKVVFEPDSLEPSSSSSVVVIGGGILGVSTAYHLSRMGISTTLLEKHEIGFGGSGRNGGQVIPGLKYDPNVLDTMYGEETTKLVGEAADFTFQLIQSLKLDCQAEQKGWVQSTCKTKHLDMLAKRTEQWSKRGVKAELLDASEMSKRLGTEYFCGGWQDPRGGTLHPLNYVKSLACAAQQSGAKIITQAEVVKWHKTSPNRLELADGTRLNADYVVLCCNAYTDELQPDLKRSIIPAHSFQVATSQLTQEQLTNVLPTKVASSDTRRIGNYFRLSPDNRLMIGGRGSFREPNTTADFSELHNEISKIFPQLDGITCTHHWYGRVAMTADHLPHIHKLTDTSLSAIGFNGRGVALTTRLGEALAQYISKNTTLPMSIVPIKPFILHKLHPAYASIAIKYYRIMDSLES
ncbi:FAD-dependent oxidoreductase [Marinomonas sp. CT5]|uniref:NAD(P)/FAD-dependent oxidoreductase n=1 Tax=Marinomonas sp. CT5 TaxID=2066133 RepID=UPI001BB0519C|nr:FAD-dependent oxidoreductase [Marinomonas sp. CT5]QUX93878.1 FAD-dependent oxidoreductase [Marinomonas sp. CT5]